ncbi:hypothetical protein T484DRAFT_1804983, partial [Baffinella frigidus]
FAGFAAVVFVIVNLALTDMFSFSITFTFWQTAALLARYHLPWPPRALSLLAAFSVANYNLEALPWKCFLDSQPTYRDLWYLTIFVPGGFLAFNIVRWLLPFFAVPPKGKELMRQFKSALRRRDYFKGVGSVVRSQYVAPRAITPPSRPTSGRSLGSRGSQDEHRPLLGASLRSGQRSESDGSHPDVLIVDDLEDGGNNQEGWVQGLSFGTKVLAFNLRWVP